MMGWSKCQKNTLKICLNLKNTNEFWVVVDIMSLIKMCLGIYGFLNGCFGKSYFFPIENVCKK